MFDQIRFSTHAMWFVFKLLYSLVLPYYTCPIIFLQMRSNLEKVWSEMWQCQHRGVRISSGYAFELYLPSGFKDQSIIYSAERTALNIFCVSADRVTLWNFFHTLSYRWLFWKSSWEKRYPRLVSSEDLG